MSGARGSAFGAAPPNLISTETSALPLGIDAHCSSTDVAVNEEMGEPLTATPEIADAGFPEHETYNLTPPQRSGNSCARDEKLPGTCGDRVSEVA